MDHLEVLIKLAKNGLPAGDLMEVGAYAPCVTLVHDLSNHAIDVQSSGEKSVQLG